MINVAIIIGSTRPGRVGESVGKWAFEIAKRRKDAQFELVDLVGLDTRLKILQYLHHTLGEKYRPAPLLVKYVKAGRLGRKVGKGVYDYNQ